MTFTRRLESNQHLYPTRRLGCSTLKLHLITVISRITSLVGEESSKERNKFEVPLPTFYIYYTKYLGNFQIFVCAFLYEYRLSWISEVRISYELQAILQAGKESFFLGELVLEFISYSFLNFMYILYIIFRKLSSFLFAIGPTGTT